MAEQFALPPELREQLENGKNVLIHVVPILGPHIDSRIIVVMNRDQILNIIELIKGENKNERKRIFRNVVNAVRNGLSDPMNPTENQDLMDDIAILFGYKLVLKSDRMLPECGILNLSLLIDGDETLTWQQRGMFDPEFMKAMGFSERPQRLKI